MGPYFLFARSLPNERRESAIEDVVVDEVLCAALRKCACANVYVNMCPAMDGDMCRTCACTCTWTKVQICVSKTCMCACACACAHVRVHGICTNMSTGIGMETCTYSRRSMMVMHARTHARTPADACMHACNHKSNPEGSCCIGVHTFSNACLSLYARLYAYLYTCMGTSLHTPPRSSPSASLRFDPSPDAACVCECHAGHAVRAMHH